MKFEYTKQYLSKKESFRQRLFEITPGLLSWTILIGMTLLSLFEPIAAAVLMIAFYLFWLFRLVYMTIFLSLSYLRLAIERKSDWKKRIQDIQDLDAYLEKIKKEKSRSWGERLSHEIHIKELSALKETRALAPPLQDIFHMVIFPVVSESKDIVEPGLIGLAQQDFSTKQMVVFYTVEERASEKIKKEIDLLVKQYENAFFHIEMVIHPRDLPGEAAVKGANVTYAAKRAAEFFKHKNIPYENIVVSCFDADTVVAREYFTCLTYYFMTTPNRIQSSFQPIPVYHNNIWDVPGFARVIETGSSFFQLVEATNPEKLVTFSSHSMSFKALVDVGYWPVDMISDDSAIYWKSFIHYDGNYSVVPMYTTVSMDIAGSKNIFETARSVYKQKRRWAWGVENFPIVMRAFLKAKKIPLRDKVPLAFKLLEGHVSWATWSFLLSFIGWLPGLFAHREYLTSVAYYNVPQASFTIFSLATLSLVVSIVISINLLPKIKVRNPLSVKLKHGLEWLTLPIILVLFGALPALDAQTRLMFGKYMEFWVTDKKRK